MNITFLFLSLLISYIFVLPDLANAQLYRWVDGKGIAHFSNRPPKNEFAKVGQPGSAKKSSAKLKLFDFREKVVRAIGIDVVELASGKKVKYIGVESSEAYLKKSGRNGAFKDAIDFHRSLVEGKTVTVLLGRKKKDAQGRYLGHVFLGQQAFINAELIRQGHALTEEYPSDFEYQSLFIRLMKDAQKSGRGVWAF